MMPPFQATGLRLLTEDDAAQLQALIVANRDHLAPWLPWAAGQTLADTEGFIRRARAQLGRDDGLQAAVVRDGEIVGIAGFHGVDWGNRSTSIGYWLAAPAQGRGTMTAAVRALIDHAFGAWGLHRVEIRVAPGNRRSRAVAERLGFREEGLLREAERLGERYLDSVVYGLLAAEWDRS